MPRLIVHFARFGPYHHARLRAAAEILGSMDWEVIGLETAGTDATYAWKEAKGDMSAPEVRTAFPGRVHEEIQAGEHRRVRRIPQHRPITAATERDSRPAFGPLPPL